MSILDTTLAQSHKKIIKNYSNRDLWGGSVDQRYLSPIWGPGPGPSWWKEKMKLLKMSSELRSNTVTCPCARTHMQNKLNLIKYHWIIFKNVQVEQWPSLPLPRTYFIQIIHFKSKSFDFQSFLSVYQSAWNRVWLCHWPCIWLTWDSLCKAGCPELVKIFLLLPFACVPVFDVLV